MGCAIVITHRRPKETAAALSLLQTVAAEEGFTLRFDSEETSKHSLEPSPTVEISDDHPKNVDLCLVLGGDGSIFTALRRFAGTCVPTFAVNFGEVGFLATVDPDNLVDDFRRAFRGEFESLRLPAISAQVQGQDWIAVNDVSIHRKPGPRVADLAYAFAGCEIGRVRCDGLVASTPQGSTGYNLANGGPVLAWGVEGFVISFIAPHSLTARPLVAAPTDSLLIENRSDEEPVDIHVDGRPVAELAAGETVEVNFGNQTARLALMPGVNFYGRLRERFGRLAT